MILPTISSTQPTRTGSTLSSMKRKSSKNAEQHSPSLFATKRRRIRSDSGCTAQQLPSPKSSLDSLLTQSGLPTTNKHHSIGDALPSDSRSGSRSSNTIRTPNPGQRSSMQPPTPGIIPTTPSRIHSVALPDISAQPTSSFSLSHKKQRASDGLIPPHFARPVSNPQSITPAPPNHLNYSKDAFKAPNPFYIHTPLRTGSKPNDWSTKPSAPAQPPIGFSAVRHQLTRKCFSVWPYDILLFSRFRVATRETLHSNH